MAGAPRFRLLCSLILGCALGCPVVQAAELLVPITLESRHLDVALAVALGLDAEGRVTLAENSCNRVEVATPRTRTQSPFLEVEAQLVVTTGVHLLGDCRGPSPWRGRMLVTLEPAVDLSGLAVRFHPVGATLVRADGTEGMLSQPVRALAETLVLPQLGLMRVDLAAPLAAIDGLLAEVLDETGTSPPLVQRAHIRNLNVVPEGLAAQLQFTVLPPSDAAVSESPLDPGELEQWTRVEDELDGFLTTVITLFAEAAEAPDLRYELLGVLLDARHAIAQALTDNQPGEDPIRALFIDAWDRLRPHLAHLEGLPIPGFDQDLRLMAFMAGGDALRALDALGPEYGIEITRDGLRRLARLLLAEGAPDSFTPLPTDIDRRLQQLFQLDPNPDSGAGRGAPLVETLVSWLVSAAHAAVPTVAYVVPRPEQLPTYLDQVATLLEFKSGARLQRSERIPARIRAQFNPLVAATAWKESCWRQFTGTAKQPKVLTSSMGALGIMQINGRVWRGLYDLDRLAEDMGYNIAAGAEILEHYLVDYALRRGEHRQPGGDDNLIRATYAAYNGGPGHLSRYRRTDTSQRLRAIDALFWDYFQKISADGRPDVSTCYPVVS